MVKYFFNNKYNIMTSQLLYNYVEFDVNFFWHISNIFIFLYYLTLTCSLYNQIWLYWTRVHILKVENVICTITNKIFLIHIDETYIFIYYYIQGGFKRFIIFKIVNSFNFKNILLSIKFEFFFKLHKYKLNDHSPYNYFELYIMWY